MRKFAVFFPGGDILVEADTVSYGKEMYSFYIEGEIVGLFTVATIYGWKELV